MDIDIETLYPLVTEAIRRAEVLADIRAPGARDAYRDVSLLEERIAAIVPASDEEGAIARRGAVRAALSAGDVARARQLTARFAAEVGPNGPLAAELAALHRDGAAPPADHAATISRGRACDPVLKEREVTAREFSEGISELLRGIAEPSALGEAATPGEQQDRLARHSREILRQLRDIDTAHRHQLRHLSDRVVALQRALVEQAKAGEALPSHGAPPRRGATPR